MFGNSSYFQKRPPYSSLSRQFSISCSIAFAISCVCGVISSVSLLVRISSRLFTARPRAGESGLFWWLSGKVWIAISATLRQVWEIQTAEMSPLQYLQGWTSLLRVTVDVCCEYGPPLSLALQLHRIQQQEVFRPIPLLCLRGLHLHYPPFCFRHDSLLQTAPKHAEEDDFGVLRRTLVVVDGQVWFVGRFFPFPSPSPFSSSEDSISGLFSTTKLRWRQTFDHFCDLENDLETSHTSATGALWWIPIHGFGLFRCTERTLNFLGISWR